uniref:hypothetical protein n=1 Tax=Enterococcus faecium TaxID=1352 RepID=UPI00292FEDD9
RDLGVFSELLSHRITAEEVKAMNPKGIILSGGPNSVYDENAFSRSYFSYYSLFFYDYQIFIRNKGESLCHF